VRDLEFLLFDRGVGTLLWLQWGALCLCAPLEAGLLTPAEQQIAMQWRSWDSSSCIGETGFSCREAQCEVLGLCAPWGSRLTVVAYRVAGYSFPPLGGESGVLAL
jgi:hypothetical protein